MTSVSNARKPATWHTIVHTLDVLISTIMGTLQQIALTRYHLQAHWQDAGITPLVDVTGQHLRTATPDVLTMTIETGTDSADLDLRSYNPRYRSNSCSDCHRSHSRPFHQPSWHTSSHHRSSSTYCYHCDTPHCRSSSCRHLSREDSRPRTHRSSKQHYKSAQGSSSSSQSMPWKPKDRRHKQVTIDNPPSEYFSSAEQDSDSEDDVN